MEQNKSGTIMKEEWIRWYPITGLEGKYEIENLIAQANSLCIILYSCTAQKKHTIEMVFTSFINTYRETNESFRINLFHELSQQYSGNFYGDWTFFKVTNSEYLTWIAGDLPLDAQPLSDHIHFCLMGYDTVVDIITSCEPTVRIISTPD